MACDVLGGSESVFAGSGNLATDINSDDIFIKSTGGKIVDIQEVGGLGCLRNGIDPANNFGGTCGESNGSGGGVFGGKGDKNLSGGDGSNERSREDIASFDAIFLGSACLFDDGGQRGDGRKNNHKGNNDSEGRFERNTPDLVIVNFGLLSSFEVVELVFREKITMVVGTGKDRDGLRNRVVFDTGHGLTTFRTNGMGNRDSLRFGKDRINVFGGFDSEEVS